MAVVASGVGLLAVIVLNAVASPASTVGSGFGGTTTTAPTGTGPSTVPTGPGSGTIQSFTGPSEQYGYGALSVKVTLQGSRIVDVSTASLQTLESYSQQLAQQVIPILKGEVLAAQSTQVNGLSGATYTVQAYLTSLQSALDSAKS